MNRILALLILFTFITTPLFAQNMMDKKGQMMETDGYKKSHMKMRSHHGMYTMMLNRAIIKAGNLELSDKQDKEIEKIEENYLYPSVKKEADFRIAHMKLMKGIHDPEFDSDDLKQQISKANSISVELANMYIDGLAELRRVVGLENFKKIVRPMPMMKNGMMKYGNDNDQSDQEESE